MKDIQLMLDAVIGEGTGLTFEAFSDITMNHCSDIFIGVTCPPHHILRFTLY